MKNSLSTLTKYYGWLLRLFPRGFRNRFGEEMILDFVDTLDAAEKRGAATLILVLLREILDFPINLLHAYLEEGRMLRILRSGAVNDGLRGAIGFGFAGATAAIASELIFWSMVAPENSIVSRLQVGLFDLFHSDHGLELISWIPSALGSLITGLVLGVLLAVLLGDRSSYPRYILSVMLGWFLHDAVQSILLEPFDLGFFLGTPHSNYLGLALAILSGSFLGLMFIAATSKSPKPIRWLAVGSFAYPLIAYLYVRLLFKWSIVTSPWLFIALTILLVMFLVSVFLIAMSGEDTRPVPWMVIVSAMAFPSMPFVGGFITRSLGIPWMLGAAPGFSGMSWSRTLTFALSDAIYAIPTGALLGLILGYLRMSRLVRIPA